MATCRECGREFTRDSGGSAFTSSISIDTCPECTAIAEGAFYRLLIEATPRVFFTPTIIALNIAIFMAMLATGVSLVMPEGEQLLRWGADFGLQTLSGEWWRLLSSVFVHIGVFHLLLNMWCLWNLGRLAERLFGNWTFLAIYLLSGIGGSLTSVMWNPRIISAGASGAVFGISGGLVAFLYFGKIALPRSIIKRYVASILTFVGYNIVLGFALGFVNNAAHLGGLLVGLALGALLHRPLPATGAPSRLRIGLIYAGAVVAFVSVAALARKTHESLIIYQRGAKHLESKINDRAIEELKRATESDPTFAPAHHDLGVAYLRKKHYEEALKAFKKCLDLNPEVSLRATAYHNLGLAYSALSRDDEAIDAFKQALQLNSQDGDALHWLGFVYLNKELYDEAIKTLKQCLQLKSQDPAGAHYLLGEAYLHKKRYDEAITAFQQSLELKPDLAEAQRGLGKAYEAAGLVDQAVAAYEQALTLDPSDAKTKLVLTTLRTVKSSTAPARRP